MERRAGRLSLDAKTSPKVGDVTNKLSDAMKELVSEDEGAYEARRIAAIVDALQPNEPTRAANLEARTRSERLHRTGTSGRRGVGEVEVLSDYW